MSKTPSFEITTTTSLELEVAALENALHTIDLNVDHAITNYFQIFTNQILAWEKIFTRQQILLAIAPVRQIAAASTFVKRAQCWPRGYAGDFETILHILEGNNKATLGSLGYLIEDFFLSSPICIQHRNKVVKQSELVAATLINNTSAKILSIGCGTSEDLYNCISYIAASSCQITLVDIDAAALEFSLDKLNAVKEKITCIEGNVYRVIKSLKDTFDLILIGGVFDYLSDKVIVVLLKTLSNKLNDDGQLFFTNINKNNPYRVCMEYLADWILIERDEEAIVHLLQKAGLKSRYVIEKDKTGLTLLVNIFNNEHNI